LRLPTPLPIRVNGLFRDITTSSLAFSGEIADSVTIDVRERSYTAKCVRLSLYGR